MGKIIDVTVSYTNKLYSGYMLGMLVKLFIAVLMLYSSRVVKC